jgi:hypothetical protein
VVAVPVLHAGLFGSVQPFLPCSAWPTKPFIAPPFTSAVAFVAPCGPPVFRASVS